MHDWPSSSCSKTIVHKIQSDALGKASRLPITYFVLEGLTDQDKGNA